MDYLGTWLLHHLNLSGKAAGFTKLRDYTGKSLAGEIGYRQDKNALVLLLSRRKSFTSHKHI